MIRLSLHLVPFAGIAFLWFIGVIREQLGDVEDRLFSTVFMGSGLLFLALLFSGAAISSSLILMLEQPSSSAEIWAYGRNTSQGLISVYAMRMAAVFTISVSTAGLRAAALPRWVSYLGYVVAVLLLLGSADQQWLQLAFPAWVLLVSTAILVTNPRERAARDATDGCLNEAQPVADVGRARRRGVGGRLRRRLARRGGRRFGLGLGDGLLEGREGGGVDGAGGLDPERGLEVLQGLGQRGRPHPVDGTVPEPGELERLLHGGGGRQLLLRDGPALGVQVVLERRRGGLVDRAGARQAVRLLEGLDGLDGRRAVDPVDLAVVVAGVAQRGLERRGVVAHRRLGLDLLLVGEAPASAKSRSHAISRATTAALNCWDACASGVSSVMPFCAAFSSCSARSHAVDLAAGASGVGLLDGGRGAGWPTAEVLRRREGRLGLRELLLGVDDGLLRGHGRLGARHGVLARLLEVAARIVDVSDGHRGLGEHVAVAVQRQDVVLARAAELGRGIGEVCLGVREVLLGRAHPGLGQVDGRAAVRVAAAAGQRSHQERPGNQRAPGSGRSHGHDSLHGLLLVCGATSRLSTLTGGCDGVVTRAG